MSLITMPFVDTGFDTGLHVVAATVMLGSLCAIVVAFWKLHELPVHHAYAKNHRQLALISALTWIGFLWHWVWVLAIIIAFVDSEAAIGRVRDIWKASPQPAAAKETDNA